MATNTPRRSTAAVAFVLLLDSTAYAVVLPALSLSYGSGAAVGALFALYSLGQLLSAPVLGRLSDRFGRRPVLAASQAGTIASLLLLLSPGYWFAVLSRGLDGVTAGNSPVAYAAALDANPKERWQSVIGLLGSATGAGVLTGVGIASLTDGTLRTTATVGAVLACASLVATLILVPAGRPAAPASTQRLSLELVRRCKVAFLAGAAQAASVMGLPALLVALGVAERTAIRYGFLALLVTAAAQTLAVPMLLRLRPVLLAAVMVLLAVAGVGLLSTLPVIGASLLLTGAVSLVARARVLSTEGLAHLGAGTASGMTTTATTAGQMLGPLLLFAALQVHVWPAMAVALVLMVVACAQTLRPGAPEGDPR